jgi:hypothetical protein
VDLNHLSELDRRGVKRLTALAFVPQAARPMTFAKPRQYVCDDGGAYWLKRDGQRGLLLEVIAGRIGARLGVAAKAAVVGVSSAAAQQDPCCTHLEGTCVGSLDLPGVDNVSRDLAHTFVNGVLPPSVVSRIDSHQRALVVVFQTWLHLADTQAFLEMASGRLYSADHGDWGPDVAAPTTRTVIFTDGLPRDRPPTSAIDAAVARVQAFSDEVLLEDVSRIPDDPGWQADAGRRLQVAEWLASRRDCLDGVMATWP